MKITQILKKILNFIISRRMLMLIILICFLILFAQGLKAITTYSDGLSCYDPLGKQTNTVCYCDIALVDNLLFIFMGMFGFILMLFALTKNGN